MTNNGINVVTTLAPSFLIRSSILAGKEDMHKCLNECEFLPDPITDYGFICP